VRAELKSRLAACLGLLLLAAACGADSAGQQAVDGPDTGDETSEAAAEAGTTNDIDDCATMTVRASHHIGEDTAGHRGMLALAESLSEQTENRITMEVFSGAQLGGLAETAENVRSGAVEVGFLGAGIVSQFAPEVGVLDLPFLFSTQDEFNELMDGDVGSALNEHVRDSGIEPLFWFSVGFRNMLFGEGVPQVQEPADMQGLTMRVPEAPIFVDTFSALGTSPTVIPAADLYTSMQTGVVDGFELPVGTVVDFSLQEVSTSMSETSHIHTGTMIGASPQWVDSLCETDRQGLEEAVQEAKEVMRSEWKQDNDNALEVLADAVEFVDVDRDAFREAVDVVYDNFREEQGSEILDMIQAATGS
jgi:tripartite ATP-independent transporter DctP family solute receptor